MSGGLTSVRDLHIGWLFRARVTLNTNFNDIAYNNKAYGGPPLCHLLAVDIIYCVLIGSAKTSSYAPTNAAPEHETTSRASTQANSTR